MEIQNDGAAITRGRRTRKEISRRENRRSFSDYLPSRRTLMAGAILGVAGLLQVAGCKIEGDRKFADDFVNSVVPEYTKENGTHELTIPSNTGPDYLFTHGWGCIEGAQRIGQRGRANAIKALNAEFDGITRQEHTYETPCECEHQETVPNLGNYGPVEGID